MNGNDLWKKPSFVLAAGLGGGAILWGLSQCVKWLGFAVGKIIQGIGAAVVIAGTAGAAGLTAAGTLAGPITVSTYALVAIAVSGVTAVGWKIVKVSRKEPYECALAIFGVISILLVDIAKEFYYGEPLRRAIFAAASGLLVLLGGALFKMRGIIYKTVGLICLFGTPSFVLASAISRGENGDLWATLKCIPRGTLAALGGMIAIIIVLIVLATNRSHEEIKSNTRAR